jgi:hypothetical protein
LQIFQRAVATHSDRPQWFFYNTSLGVTASSLGFQEKIDDKLHPDVGTGGKDPSLGDSSAQPTSEQRHRAA